MDKLKTKQIMIVVGTMMLTVIWGLLIIIKQ